MTAIEQINMTRKARKPAVRASVDQLSFLFADASLESSVESIGVVTPAPVVEIASPTRTRTPRRQREAKRAAPVAPNEDRRLTVEDAAEILSVSVKTLEAWRRLGKGPEFVKLGRSVRYTMRAL